MSHHPLSFNLQENFPLMQSATSQPKQNALLQPQQHLQSQHSIQQPIAPQQQLDLTISSETVPSAQNNEVLYLLQILIHKQNHYYFNKISMHASSQAVSQSFSSAISDCLLK